MPRTASPCYFIPQESYYPLFIIFFAWVAKSLTQPELLPSPNIISVFQTENSIVLFTFSSVCFLKQFGHYGNNMENPQITKIKLCITLLCHLDICPSETKSDFTRDICPHISIRALLTLAGNELSPTMCFKSLWIEMIECGQKSIVTLENNGSYLNFSNHFFRRNCGNKVRKKCVHVCI